MHRRIAGIVTGIVVLGALCAAMLPLRPHLSVATSALVLVIPVVVGVAAGGLIAGLVCVTAGFLAYDVLFIPPYGTLSVGSLQNWVALIVYVVVMVAVAQLVSNLDRARSATQQRADNARLLFELSEMLLRDLEPARFNQGIVDELRLAFELEGAELFLSSGDRLSRVASSGVVADQIPGIRPVIPGTLNRAGSTAHSQTLPLVAGDRPVGLLVLHGLSRMPSSNELLPTLANHVALALERSQLRERAMQAELLEEIDRLQRALFGAVSHDLRSPLATIKFASSSLVDSSTSMPEEDRSELYHLIDSQTDRLTRLVTSLLDMTRIQAGVLEVRREHWGLRRLVDSVVAAVQPSMEDRELRVDIARDLPEAEMDHLLIEQVLSNLIDNAHRHAPSGSPIVISGGRHDASGLALSVTDHGAGVNPSEREHLFESFVRFDTGGRAGLGLAIAKAFVVAHDGEIWVEDPPEGGARFTFTLEVADSSRDHAD